MAEDITIVVRNGTVIDGTGASPYEADVAIAGGKIVEIGRISNRGAEEIDAKGKLVTPGFVDIHTHYDAQSAWVSRMTPSSWHGVTSAVMGNCGVGFAPCKLADRDQLGWRAHGGRRRHPRRGHGRGSESGSGRVLANSSPRWNAARATSTSALCFRMPPCASTSWVIEPSVTKPPTRATSRRCAKS